MTKESAAYVEHITDIFAEILHQAITIRPLQELRSDVTPSLAHGLQFILRHEVCSVRDIAQGLSMTYSAASQLTERLVKKGLVTRSENMRDRRLSEIRLTDEGCALAENIRHRRVQSISRILDRLPSDRRTALVRHLEEFIAAAMEDLDSALDTCTHCGKDHIAECIVNEVHISATGTPIEKA